MTSRRFLPLILLLPLSILLLAGFLVQPRPVAQDERVRLSDLATRVADLEEANVELEARVAELERVVDELVLVVATETGEDEPDNGAESETVEPEADEPAGLMPGRAPSEATATPTPAATPTEEAIQEPADEPGEEGEEEPGAEPAEEPEEEPAAEPEEEMGGLPSLDDFEIDWGPLPNYFEVSNIRVEMQQVRDVAGRFYDVEVLAFDVEAKTSFMLGIFYANFYDAEGVEVASFSLVEFIPDYLMGWQPGTRSRARVILPANMSQIDTIRFRQM